MKPWRGIAACAAACAAACLLLASIPGAGAVGPVSIPLRCTHGPRGQRYEMTPSVPRAVAQGSTFTVRIDGHSSGEISHTGLRYIHDMTTEMLIPPGTTLVEGSARVVPATGTPNVRAGARIAVQAGAIRMVLPAQVAKGSDYTPPSFEFSLKVTAPAGAKIVQSFSRYEVTARAFLIGDVRTACEPSPRPHPVATTAVTAIVSESPPWRSIEP